MIENQVNIFNGDCLDILPKIDSNSIDLILCDLPYGVTACKWDSEIPLESLWAEYHRIIKDNGVILLFGIEPFSSKLRMSNLKEYKYDWIWEKNTGSNFLHAKRMPIRYTENISVFIKGSSWYFPQKTFGHVPTNSGKGRNTGRVYSGKSIVDYKGGDTTRFPKNILKFKTVNNYSRKHPSEKPVELLKYLIESYTREGEVVLDNAMGVASTGIACLETKRRFIGIEKEDLFYKLSEERLQTFMTDNKGNEKRNTENNN